MESQKWHQLASSVWGWFRKGTRTSAHLDATHFRFSLYNTGAFQLLPGCCSSEGVIQCVGSLRGTVWGSSSFFHRLNPHWFLQPEFVGTYLPGTGTLGWGAWCGAGTPCSLDSPSVFSRTTHEWGTSLFCICAPPTSLDGCGFFNSVVVRLPFNSISAGSGWWLFHILVVILMWLCEEVSHVCLCHHLDQNPISYFCETNSNSSLSPEHILSSPISDHLFILVLLKYSLLSIYWNLSPTSRICWNLLLYKL